MKISLSGNWKLKGNGYEIEGHVPGDVTDDFIRAGIIADPYFDENYKDALWITRSDWTYEKTFHLDEIPQGDVRLHFDGVDTFADVYVNGTLVGNAKNMHRIYEFSVKDVLKTGENVLTVQLKNIYKEMGDVDQDKYDSIFCANRIFVRKAQCHFGWDWAPKFPGYGIYRDVYLIAEAPSAIDTVQVQADCKGNATFRVAFKAKHKGETEVSVLYEGKQVAFAKKATDCKKFLINLRVDTPKLWWPNGYGEHPLYGYVITQKDENGNVVSVREGRFAFRSVELDRSVRDENNLGFALKINGRQVFCRGSNWVPAECMTGRITDERYYTLVKMAQEANMNMLRVWGGGIYEKDCFYDYCDEMGIMVWQEFMFACSEVPEDKPGFVEEITEEAIGQVRRLRNHPSIVLWCGMNEIRGAFSEVEERYSIFTLHYLFRGIVADESPDTPYIRTSPFCFADVENDESEGDCHNNLSERCLFDAGFKGFDAFEYGKQDEGEALKYRIKNYERYVVGTESNFSSECAVLGMCNYESLVKFTPKEKITVDSKFFEERFLGNPYTYVMPTFFERQKTLAEGMFGTVTNVKDLVKKANRSQADIMKTEILYARVNGRSTGFMNWMFNDIWPTGTWSVVDYYYTTKPAYYEMKRSFAPVVADMFRAGDEYYLCFINDTQTPLEFAGEIARKDYVGSVQDKQTVSGTVPADGFVKIKVSCVEAGAFRLVAQGTLGGKPFTTGFDLGRYGEYPIPCDCTFETAPAGENEWLITVKANSFVPCIQIWAGENAWYEDNYFDVDAGNNKIVRVRTSEKPENFSFRTFADEWDK